MTILCKESAHRPNVLNKGMKRRVPNGLRGAIVGSRREVCVAKASVQRYAELPSLRYGASPTPTATQMLGSGPLRVGANPPAAGATATGSVRRSKSFTADVGVGTFRGSRNNSQLRSQEAPPAVRRVHFAELPPKATREAGEGKAGEGAPWTENRTRSRSGANAGSSVASDPRSERRCLASSASFPPPSRSDPFRLGNNGATQGGTVLSNRHASLGHDTIRYRRGTLTQVPATAPTPLLPPLLQAARDGGDDHLTEALRKAARIGISADELNAADSSGRTALSYISSNGDLNTLEAILRLPGIDVNKSDNEGNTPLHFAAQAGQVEVISCLLSAYGGLDVDARNTLGFTPLMKAALQGRTKCAKLLLCAGASPVMRDGGRGLRAEQWARFCGRYSCADVIEKFSRTKPSGRNGDHSRWGSEPELAARIFGGKVTTDQSGTSASLKSRIRKAFRTTSHPGHDSAGKPFSIVDHLTAAAVCASGLLLPSNQKAPPPAKSIVRPLALPKVQVTLSASLNGDDQTGKSGHDADAKDRQIPSRFLGNSKKK